MERTSKILVALLALMLGISIVLNFHFRAKLQNVHTESFIDTVRVDLPVPRDSVVIKYKTAYLPAVQDTTHVYDTSKVTIYDSVRVYVPITQKIYKEKEYTAWVSGYSASLDSLELHLPTTVITRTEKTPLLDCGIGLQGGVTWVPQDGFKPYLGVGVQIGISFRKFKRK